MAVRRELEPFLPAPRIVREKDGSFALDSKRPKSIWRVRGFLGPFGVLVKAYAFIRVYGSSLK